MPPPTHTLKHTTTAGEVWRLPGLLLPRPHLPQAAHLHPGRALHKAVLHHSVRGDGASCQRACCGCHTTDGVGGGQVGATLRMRAPWSVIDDQLASSDGWEAVACAVLSAILAQLIYVYCVNITLSVSIKQQVNLPM